MSCTVIHRYHYRHSIMISYIVRSFTSDGISLLSYHSQISWPFTITRCILSRASPCPRVYKASVLPLCFFVPVHPYPHTPTIKTCSLNSSYLQKPSGDQLQIPPNTIAHQLHILPPRTTASHLPHRPVPETLISSHQESSSRCPIPILPHQRPKPNLSQRQATDVANASRRECSILRRSKYGFVLLMNVASITTARHVRQYTPELYGGFGVREGMVIGMLWILWGVRSTSGCFFWGRDF